MTTTDLGIPNPADALQIMELWLADGPDAPGFEAQASDEQQFAEVYGSFAGLNMLTIQALTRDPDFGNAATGFDVVASRYMERVRTSRYTKHLRNERLSDELPAFIAYSAEMYAAFAAGKQLAEQPVRVPVESDDRIGVLNELALFAHAILYLFADSNETTVPEAVTFLTQCLAAVDA